MLDEIRSHLAKTSCSPIYVCIRQRSMHPRPLNTIFRMKINDFLLKILTNSVGAMSQLD